MRRFRLCANFLLVLIFLEIGTALAADSINAAPLFQREARETPNGTMRVCGPIFENTRTAAGEQSLLAIRPLWSRFSDEQQDLVVHDFLWPIASSRLRELSLRRHFLLALSGDTDVSDPDGEEYGFLLPIYFRGIASNGESYHALFPVGGHIKEFVGFDDLQFALFPLYLGTRHGEVIGRHLLWPLLSSVQGPELRRRRLFPLAGYSRNENEREQRFFLWPLIHAGHSLNVERPWRGWFFFPLVGRLVSGSEQKSNQRCKISVLWPFFTMDRGSLDLKLYCPWPFFQLYTNRDESEKQRLFLWPLYGKDTRPLEEYRFALWPIYSHTVRRDEDHQVIWSRRYVMPFFWSFWAKSDDGFVTRYRRFWPFCSIESKSDTSLQVRALDLWPQRKAEPVERNWAPLWTIYSRDRDQERERVEVLWGLYQSVRDGNVHRRSLFPFFAYTRDFGSGEKRLRLFHWLRFSRARDRE